MGRRGRGSILLTCAGSLLVAACEGPVGPMGARGEAGPPGPPAMMEDASPGASDAGPHMDDGGERDAMSPPFLGLQGVVRDRSGALLTAGRVLLVPSARIAELTQQPVDLSLSANAARDARNDEPLEDVIDVEGEKLPQSAVSDQGSYRIEVVPDGAYFPVYLPAKDDEAHLPGGDPARTPRAAETLRGATFDLTVSGAPTSQARNIGSSACITCHGRQSALASAHANTIRVPAVRSALQDLSGAPRCDELLTWFEQGKSLYFSECSTSHAPLPACKVTSSPPAAGSAPVFEWRFVRDQTIAKGEVGAYAVELHGPNDASSVRYDVALTIGGQLSYEQLIARVKLPDGSATHRVLPLSYQLQGDDHNASYRDYAFIAYRAEDWFDFAQGSLREPAYEQAFERQCAGCHVSGFALTGSNASGFHARAAADAQGTYDLDGNGQLDQLAVGCESCHGPGSEHVEQMPRGQHIVSPQLLTVERQTLLCGACHSNGRGHDGSLAPLDADGHMPAVGERRSTFLADHQSTLEGSLGGFFASGDSRASHQQYSDFVRSKKARSTSLLAVCTDCHAPHREAGLSADLRYAASDDAGCRGCHAEAADIHKHAQAKVSYDHVVGLSDGELTCTSCHMIKTAAGGAHVSGLVDQSSPNHVVSYLQGDRTSHRFVVESRARAAEQPVAATQACAFCHADFLPN